jgi:hypothetical protein
VFAGLGVGLGLRELIARIRHVVSADLELRYGFTDWSGATLERANGETLRALEVDGERVPLGQGPSHLHQLGLIASFRFGFLEWSER